MLLPFVLSSNCLENARRRDAGALPGEGVLKVADDAAVVPDAVDTTRGFPGVEKLGREPRERSCRVNWDCEDESAPGWALSAADIAAGRTLR